MASQLLGETSWSSRPISKYDGTYIYSENERLYELRYHLGSGCDGNVMQGICMKSQKEYAFKILNPIPFRINTLQNNNIIVLQKGVELDQDQVLGNAKLRAENVHWVFHKNFRIFMAAYEDPKSRVLKELSLIKCIEVFGLSPFGEDFDEADLGTLNVQSTAVTVNGVKYNLPIVPVAYVKWLGLRRRIFREMKNMGLINNHPNVIRLYDVLELVNESKSTLFLVLELATGGILFDRIQNMKSFHEREEMTKKYVSQLLSGLDYCHCRGIAHRDLKPENLLLSDDTENATLKIADFGFSAITHDSVQSSPKKQTVVDYSVLQSPSTASIASPSDVETETEAVTLRRLKSIVGSPFYIAPEIGTEGYDGKKTDMWSVGVIIYSLLTDTFPFSQYLNKCERYKEYQKWLSTEYAERIRDGKAIELPMWFFPEKNKTLAGSLIVRLLHPDPDERLNAAEALRHPWFLGDSARKLSQLSDSEDCHIGKEGKSTNPSNVKNSDDLGNNNSSTNSDDEKQQKECDVLYNRKHKLSENKLNSREKKDEESPLFVRDSEILKNEDDCQRF